MTTGERIVFFRKTHKINQQSFADAVEISRTHISKIENNQDKPSDKLLKKIAKQFNISYEWLKNGTGEMCLSEEEILLKSPEFLRQKMKDTTKNMEQLFKDSSPSELQFHLYSLALLIDTFSHIKCKCDEEDYIGYAESIELLTESLWQLSLARDSSTLSERKAEFITRIDKYVDILKNILNVL